MDFLAHLGTKVFRNFSDFFPNFSDFFSNFSEFFLDFFWFFLIFSENFPKKFQFSDFFFNFFPFFQKYLGTFLLKICSANWDIEFYQMSISLFLTKHQPSICTIIDIITQYFISNGKMTEFWHYRLSWMGDEASQ